MLRTVRHTRHLSSTAPLLSQRPLVLSSRALYGCRYHDAAFSTKTPVRAASFGIKPPVAVPFVEQPLPATPTTVPPQSGPVDAAKALARLPTPSLLRSLLIQNISAYPRFLSFLLSLLKNNADLFIKAPILRHVLDQVFYAHYCAGATEAEVSRTVDGLQQLGYKGVILNYAKEVDTPGAHPAEAKEKATEAPELHEQQVRQWLEGTLKTIAYTPNGQYVAIKFSGAGTGVVDMLERNQEKPDAVFTAALTTVCDAGRDKNVKLLIDAEHQCQQSAIDRWTMALMEQYNKDSSLVVYNTYQMYLKAAAAVLSTHLQHAATNGFNFGAKLVRGAYLASDPRHLIHDTKADTDAAFDAAAEKLATYHLGTPKPAVRVGVVIGSHNAGSIRKIRAIRHQQVLAGQPVADVVYSQLMGMADELSLSLTSADREAGFRQGDCDVYKYVTWGTTRECVMYLVRRAEENRDAVASARDARGLFWRELKRRCLPTLAG